MSNQTSAYCYGSAAVKIEYPHLILHEGGAGRVSGRSCDDCAPKPLGLGVLVASVLVCVAVLAGGFLAQARATQAIARALDQAPTSERVIGDGDTVWQLAQECDVPGASTRDVADWIVRVNSLDGGLVAVGQHVIVPGVAASAR